MSPGIADSMEISSSEVESKELLEIREEKMRLKHRTKGREVQTFQ